MKRILVIFLIVLCLTAFGQMVTSFFGFQAHRAKGRIVTIDSGALHLNCQGPTTGPLVVLEAGAIGWSDTWAWVQAELATDARVCSYDRPGLGWSTASGDYTALTAARALHEALLVSGETPTAITLVGHSYGALVIRAFAGEYPELVRGLAFIDGSHPRQFDLLPPGFVERAENFNRLLKPLGLLAATGWVRLLNPLGKMAAELPSELAWQVRLVGSSTAHLRNSGIEMERWPVSASQAERTDLSRLPLLIISAAVMHDAESGDYAAWLALQRQLAEMSERSTHLVIPHSDHFSLLMNPQHAAQVSLSIREFIQQ